MAGGHRFAGIGPTERVGHRVVEVFKERFQFVFEVGNRGEVATTHHLSHHDPEDHFDLVQPRTVFGQKYEPDSVAWIGQERPASGLRFEHSRFAFFFPMADSARSVRPPIRPRSPTNAR